MNIYNPQKVNNPNLTVKNIKFGLKSPNIILAISVCRSGSTAFLKIFSIGYKILSLYQPFKSVLRNKMHGINKILDLNKYNGEKYIFMKETIGPYTSTESRFNPYKIFIKSKFKQEKLKIIFIIRSPIDVYLSWIKNWSRVCDKADLLSNLYLSYKTLLNVYLSAKKNGVKSTIFIYEKTQKERELTFKKMFRQIGLKYTKYSIEGWGKFNKSKYMSNIIFPNEPSIYNRGEISKLHKKFFNSNSFSYMTNLNNSKYKLDKKERYILRKCKKIYNSFLKADT